MSDGSSTVFRGECLAPFYDASLFSASQGFVDGRLCETIGNVTCCLPCPLADWIYPDTFNGLVDSADWVAVVSSICCLGLLTSWAVLPVEKTSRHYLSICLTVSILFMNVGFIIPLAANPKQCYDLITPNSMNTSVVCAASGSLIIVGGWSGVIWVFLRSLSLHLQICWQLVVGRSFMYFAQTVGWGIPVIGIVCALIFSGVSFRYGDTCHINHDNSLATLWIPLLVFAALTIIMQFTTFGYCIKVYLVSLADGGALTEQTTGLPSYTNSIRTMTPKQAYQRVRRVIQLQWRGIAIVLIIIADVIFFSVVFVYLDRTDERVKDDPTIALDWLECIVQFPTERSKCFESARQLAVDLPTVSAVLILLAMNGIWLVFLLGRWSMLVGWRDIIMRLPHHNKKEFVSVDARLDVKGQRSYEMLYLDGSGKSMDQKVTSLSVVVPVSPMVKASSLHAAAPSRDFGSANADANAKKNKGGTVLSANPVSPIVQHPLRLAAASPTYDLGKDCYYHRQPYPNQATPNSLGCAIRYTTPARSFSSPRPPRPDGNRIFQDTYARSARQLSNASIVSALSTDHDHDPYVNPLGMNRM